MTEGAEAPSQRRRDAPATEQGPKVRAALPDVKRAAAPFPHTLRPDLHCTNRTLARVIRGAGAQPNNRLGL